MDTGPDRDVAPGSRLSSQVLARREQLPRKPAPVHLVGARVSLSPLDLDRDLEMLHQISNGDPFDLGGRHVDAYDPEERIWRYMYAGPFADASSLAEYLEPLVSSPTGLALCVRDTASGFPVGVANYLNNAPEHLRVELGSIWYSPVAQATGANSEATYLMLRHAFALGYRRVEWKCNSRNERSRRAALRLGFRFEGTLESYGISKDCNRDSTWFRMLDREWPEVRLDLERMLTDM